MTNCTCGHAIEQHPDLGACQVDGCTECLTYEQAGGEEEPGRWLKQPDWKGDET